jgi:integrase
VAEQSRNAENEEGVRTFALSPRLCATLRETHCTDRPTDQDLGFHTKHGNPWDGDTIRKGKLHPLLQRLGITAGRFHAFRHGNATIMDRASVPTKVPQDRLGHVDFTTTLGYPHVVSLDDQRAEAELERVIFGNVQKTPEQQRPALNICGQIAGGNA